MQTLKDFLLNLSMKKDKKISSHARGLALALRDSTITAMNKLSFHVMEEKEQKLVCEHCKNALKL